MLDSRTRLPPEAHQLGECPPAAPPLNAQSRAEFATWALFSIGDLVLSVVLLVHLLERAAQGEIGLWEPAACSAIGLAFLFVVGCYAMRVTAPRRASPPGAAPPG